MVVDTPMYGFDIPIRFRSGVSLVGGLSAVMGDSGNSRQPVGTGLDYVMFYSWFVD